MTHSRHWPAPGVMQSPEEWETRNAVLASSMSALINRFAGASCGEGDRGIDVGCQKGAWLRTRCRSRRRSHPGPE